MNAELIKVLKEDAEWADANEYEVPINLGDTLREAAEEIKRLTAHAAQTSLFDGEG